MDRQAATGLCCHSSATQSVCSNVTQQAQRHFNCGSQLWWCVYLVNHSLLQLLRRWLFVLNNCYKTQAQPINARLQMIIQYLLIFWRNSSEAIQRRFVVF